MDFSDLIERTRALLAAEGRAAWVLWKLDGGIDHVLVDEAQDTSPAQWELIRLLVAEFFAVKSGMIQEIHAVLFNLPDAQPTGWEPWYGPGRGGS